jgi:hypothetical protein
MPNTIHPGILRQHYHDRFAEHCTLSFTTIARLWASTGTPSRGRNVSRTELFNRAAKTIDLMRNLQAKDHGQ